MEDIFDLQRKVIFVLNFKEISGIDKEICSYRKIVVNMFNCLIRFSLENGILRFKVV